MIDAMTRSRMAKPLRVMTLSIALLLFAVGSNYCLVAALSGNAMACLSAPGASAAKGSHCSHHAAGPRGHAPATPPSSPCCVSLAPVAGVQVAKADVTPELPLADLEPTFAAPRSLAHRGSAEARGRPPTPLDPRSSRRGRAPPTA